MIVQRRPDRHPSLSTDVTGDVAVREHESQHDTIAELLLVTESTTVTDVTTTDRDRRSEVRTTVQRWLETRELADQHPVGRTAKEWRQLQVILVAYERDHGTVGVGTERPSRASSTLGDGPSGARVRETPGVRISTFIRPMAEHATHDGRWRGPSGRARRERPRGRRGDRVHLAR